MIFEGEDITRHPFVISSIHDGFFEKIELNEQIEFFLDIMEKKKQVQQMRPIARNLKVPQPPKFTQETIDLDFSDSTNVTFKTNVLVIQSSQKVRISHYEKGPNLFYVQLESLDSQLQNLMEYLQTVQTRNLKSRPTLLGMGCLAKHRKKIYRVAVAKIPGETQDSVVCHFVDFGFTSPVKFENLYYIPEELSRNLTFAIPFCLVGIENSQIKTSWLECAYHFRQITENRLLKLDVCKALDGNECIFSFFKLIIIINILFHFRTSYFSIL